jgi:hypothetical protein
MLNHRNPCGDNSHHSPQRAIPIGVQQIIGTIYGPTSWLRRIPEKAVNAFGIAVVMLLFISFVVGAVTILKFAWSIFAR